MEHYHETQHVGWKGTFGAWTSGVAMLCATLQPTFGMASARRQVYGPIRVPVMQDFVNVAADYVEEDEVILTTLAVFAQNGWFQNPVSPRLKEIAAGLADRRGRNSALRSEFAGAMRSWPPENLEIMLKTARERDPGVEERFSWAINRVFCHIGWQIEWAPLEDFVNRLAGIAETHHCFVSFNYDFAPRSRPQPAN